jgi:hypothetical protein
MAVEVTEDRTVERMPYVEQRATEGTERRRGNSGQSR